MELSPNIFPRTVPDPQRPGPFLPTPWHPPVRPLPPRRQRHPAHLSQRRPAALRLGLLRRPPRLRAELVRRRPGLRRGAPIVRLLRRPHPRDGALSGIPWTVPAQPRLHVDAAGGAGQEDPVPLCHAQDRDAQGKTFDNMYPSARDGTMVIVFRFRTAASTTSRSGMEHTRSPPSK